MTDTDTTIEQEPVKNGAFRAEARLKALQVWQLDYYQDVAVPTISRQRKRWLARKDNKA